MIVGPENLPGRAVLHCGDCLVVLPTIATASVDSIVTDPPYGLEFMGKEWDGSDGFRRSLNEADVGRDSAFGRMSARAPEYRTAGTGQKNKPGIGARDTEWVSNQGWNQFRCGTCGHLFHGGSPCQCADPKPVRADNRWNLFQAWCEAWAKECLRVLKPGGYFVVFGGTRTYHRMACAVEDAGFEIRDQIGWLYGQGFPKNQAALKPGWEPIALARKPLEGTLAGNVEKWGTGALDIDGCRIGDFVNETPSGADRLNARNHELGYRPNAYQRGREGEASADRRYTDEGSTNFAATPGARGGDARGRWPANVIHDGSEEVIEAFPDGLQSGTGAVKRSTGTGYQANAYGKESRPVGTPNVEYGDSGSAARFYYTAKADADDRLGSKHPTVKPVDLMAYLVRLVTPKGGTVLDPLAGTGTTGEGAFREGMQSILIEKHPEYQDDIRRRMALTQAGPAERARETAKARGKTGDLGPLFAEVNHAG